MCLELSNRLLFLIVSDKCESAQFSVFQRTHIPTVVSTGESEPQPQLQVHPAVELQDELELEVCLWSRHPQAPAF